MLDIRWPKKGFQENFLSDFIGGVSKLVLVGYLQRKEDIPG